MHKPKKTNSENIVSIRHALSECRAYYETESKHTKIVNDQTTLLMRTTICILMYTLAIPDQQHLSDIFLHLPLSEIIFDINFTESLSQTSRSYKNLKRGREIDIRKVINYSTHCINRILIYNRD
jgi:hypothetical protein